MDTSVSYIAKPHGAIAFVIKLTVFFLGGRGALLDRGFSIGSFWHRSPGRLSPPLLFHVWAEEIFDVDLQVVFGVLGQVKGGIQHAPDGDDADEVADQDAAEDGLGDITAQLPFAFALMGGEDLLEGEIKVVEGFCILLGVCVLVFHAVTEPLTDESDAAPHAVLVDLAKIEAAALDHIAFMGDGALDGRHGCFAGELADNVFLSFEVVIEGAFGHAGVLRDVFH